MTRELKSKPKTWEIYVSVPVHVHPRGGWAYKVKEENLVKSLAKILNKYGDVEEGGGYHLSALTVGVRPPESLHWYWLDVEDLEKLIYGEEVEVTVTLGLNNNAYGKGHLKLPEGCFENE